MILLDPLAHPVIAHRGASGIYPENTLRAFREAVAAGVDALEFDVRVTRDRVPVVLHDARVDRTTNGTGLLAGLTLAAVRELNAGDGEPIPTLTEVLDTFPTLPLLIEIKEPAATPPVVREIRLRGRETDVLLGAFETASLRPGRRAGLATVASRSETVLARLACVVPGIPRLGRYAAFSVPVRSGRIRVVTRAFVRRASRDHRPVHVWTVNDVEAARTLWTMGVSGVITNYPDRIRRARDRSGPSMPGPGGEGL